MKWLLCISLLLIASMASAAQDTTLILTDGRVIGPVEIISYDSEGGLGIDWTLTLQTGGVIAGNTSFESVETIMRDGRAIALRGKGKQRRQDRRGGDCSNGQCDKPSSDKPSNRPTDIPRPKPVDPQASNDSVPPPPAPGSYNSDDVNAEAIAKKLAELEKQIADLRDTDKKIVADLGSIGTMGKGEPGAPGAPGAPGTHGTNGTNGSNGKDAVVTADNIKQIADTLAVDGRLKGKQGEPGEPGDKGGAGAAATVDYVLLAAEVTKKLPPIKVTGLASGDQMIPLGGTLAIPPVKFEIQRINGQVVTKTEPLGRRIAINPKSL